MELLCRVSRGKTGEGDTGKRDYRHRARIGCVEKREVAHWYFCNPHMQADTGKSYYQYRCWRMCPPVDFFPMDVSNDRSPWYSGGRGEYWSRKREGMSCHLLRKVLMSKKKILLINPAFP